MAEAAAEVLAGLLDDLAVTEVAPDHYRGENRSRISMGLRHLFGGQVLAQALLSAAATVHDGKSANSLHAYFLRAGDPQRPIEYLVDRVRDGRRLACRCVSARQDGEVIATVLTSFAATAGGVEHQVDPPACPRPEALPTLYDAATSWGGLGPSWVGFEAIDVRVEPFQLASGVSSGEQAGDSADFIWQRAIRPITDNQVLHQAMLVYMSDIMLLAAALVPHGVPIGKEDAGTRPWDGVSLDHTIWFHRPARADEWLLFAQSSPFAGSGRSLSRAEVFDLDGRLVASTGQEGLIFNLADGASSG